MISRRRLGLAAAAVGLAGCAGQTTSSAPRSGAPRSTGGSTGTPSTSRPPGTPTEHTGALPTVRRWQPDAGDLQPACKLAAARHIEALGNGRGHALQVLEAQYGGLLTDTASVLVVTRAWRFARQTLISGGHTFDVRLTRTGAASWQVTAVHPSTPGRPAATTTSAARHVLAAPRIQLPPAGRADVASGRVHDSTLEAMLTVSRAHHIRVSVVRSGHPILVFGTDRPSDHPLGRAFDTWAVDGHPVVDPRTPRSLVTAYMERLAAAGSYNVGGPYLLGAAPQWFSDDTHHDHVHAGFTT